MQLKVLLCVYTPRPFHFPLDHGPHPQYQTEWWYFTGNLTGSDGSLYGYQLTIFRNALTPDMPKRISDLATNQIYMAHFALTDAAGDRHVSFERFSRGAGGLAGAVGEPAFGVWLEDWSAREIQPGMIHVQAAAQDADGKPVAVDLTLRETRPPVLHGDQGLSQKGPEPGNASYYYSLIGLDTSGTVTAQEHSMQVTGVSWMDHEFGTSSLSANAVGWDWFSVQLDNRTAMMLAQIRTTGGGELGIFQGTYVDAKDHQKPVKSNELQVTVLDHWTSPATGITYPSGWRIWIPNDHIDLKIKPLIRDQEMQVSFIYWEGAVSVQGTINGEPVNGVGYVELTGYGSTDAGKYQR